MHQSKLIKLLKRLTPEEFRRFSKFVQSPIYNTNPTLIRMYEVLKTTAPKWSSSKLEKKAVFQQLYPGKPFNYHLMGSLMCAMRKVLESYLVFLENEKDPWQQKQTLIKAYGRRNIYDLFEKGTNTLTSQLHETAYRDTRYFLDMLDLKYNYYAHPLTNRHQLKHDDLQEIIESLDRYFTLKKMKIASEMKAREKLLPTNYNIKNIEQVIDFIKNDPSPSLSVLSSIYLNIYYMLKNDNEKHFNKIKTLFRTHIDKIRKEEQKIIFQELTNFAARKINQGKTEYNEQSFNLYQLGLDRNILIENNRITESTFNNIVSTAGVLEKYKWTNNFIKKYSQWLDPEFSQQIITLSLAELDFRKKKYQELIDRLINKDFTTVLYETKSRFLKISAWYELMAGNDNNSHFLLSHIDSFYKYVKRKKGISKSYETGYINFLRFTKNLVLNSDKYQRNKAFRQKRIEELKNTNIVFGKMWLIKKMESTQFF